jgi:hypothetical protein
MRLDGRISVVVPEAYINEAAKVMQAFDFDTGGFYSFTGPTEDGLYYASMPADEEMEALFNRIWDKPGQLTNFVQEDYDARHKPSDETWALMKPAERQAERFNRFRREDAEALELNMLVDRRSIKEMERELGLNTRLRNPTPPEP